MSGDTGEPVQNLPGSGSGNSELLTPRAEALNKRDLFLKELKIISTYCLIPIPMSLIWSLVVGGFSDYNNYLIYFTGIAFELFGVLFMVYMEDYARLEPKSPETAVGVTSRSRQSPSTNATTVESKYEIFNRALAALSIFLCTFMFVVQLANWAVGAKTIDVKGKAQPAIIWIMDHERRLFVLLLFLQIGVAACLAFTRVIINLGVLLIRTVDGVKYPIYGLLIHHYVSNFILPIFSS